jgi:hypothetical protein
MSLTKTLTGLELIENADLALAGQNQMELKGTVGLIWPWIPPTCIEGFLWT